MASLSGLLDKATRSALARKAFNFTVLAFFFGFVLIPSLWVFPHTLTRLDQMYTQVIAKPEVLSEAVTSLIRSVEIALAVVVIDVAVGVPVAWILVRRKFMGKEFLDTLLDLPVTMPTSALGFSIYLFWATPRKLSMADLLGLKTGFLSEGPLLVLALHAVFCLPYVVRSVIGMVSELDPTYEYAARTLGAPSFTTFRTVSLPSIVPGIVSGAILAFTRSVSETGATMIVAGWYETAPVYIKRMCDVNPDAASLVTISLIATSLVLVFALSALSAYWRVPIVRVLPSLERWLSTAKASAVRDFVILAFLAVVVFAPTFYIAVAPLQAPPQAQAQRPDSTEFGWDAFAETLVNSLLIASGATAVGLLLGLPLAMYISRRLSGRLKVLLDTLVNVSVIVPTSALAYSLYLFWGDAPGGLGLFEKGLALVVVVHMVLTFPYVVRPILSALEGLDPVYEEAALTLGAKPYTVFRTVVLPLIRPAILAGVVLSFTRSFSETGATVIASGAQVRTTVPVLIVGWVKQAQKLGDQVALYNASIACALLLGLSYAMLVAFRLVMGRVK